MFTKGFERRKKEFVSAGDELHVRNVTIDFALPVMAAQKHDS